MSYKAKILNKFMDSIEKTGKILPNPITLFAGLAVFVLILSQLAVWLNWTALNPVNHEKILPVSLLTHAGIEKILNKMIFNFVDFIPLGLVITVMFGVGLADKSGLISTVIKLTIIKTPHKLVTFTIVLIGILSNMATGAVGYVLFIPLAGIIFIHINRNPIIGIAAAFAGVGGGFSANLFITSLEPLLCGVTTEAVEVINKGYEVTPISNYYFFFVSSFVIALLGTFITEKIIAPRFINYEREFSEELKPLKKIEYKGLFHVVIAIIIMIIVILYGVIPENGFLRSSDNIFLHSPFIKSITVFVFFFFGINGIVYGLSVGSFKSESDIANCFSESIKSLSSYIALCFFAAQFIEYFKWSKLGEIFAVNGASFLNTTNIRGIPLFILFILLAAILNLIIASASAKWAILAPVFVPMFMQLGYSPELTQMLYRIGDSTTNIITPMMSFFPLIITFFQKYDKDANIGTVISTMIPYSIVFLFGWIILAVIWVLFNLPLGPGAPLFYN